MLFTDGIWGKTILKLRGENNFREGLHSVSVSAQSIPAVIKHPACRTGPTVFSDSYLWEAAQAEQRDKRYPKEVP